jgi:poly-gamma-glutamate synthesis protein (capsule biosynthesis protein)
VTRRRAFAGALLASALVVVGGACSGGDDEPTARARPARKPANSTTTTTTTLPVVTTTIPPTTTTAVPAFVWTVAAVDGDVRERVEGSSWRPGCPVPLEDLRYVRVQHWDFGGSPRLGELIIHADAVDDLQAVFAALYAQRFPIRSMRLVDDFGADDDASIDAGNTSAFNCRAVSGGSGWSQHAYGRAIDVNPLENPYVSGGTTSHAASVPYLDRSNVRPGMIVAGDAVVDAFADRGWGWGGYWSSPVDYQHFSATGG